MDERPQLVAHSQPLSSQSCRNNTHLLPFITIPHRVRRCQAAASHRIRVPERPIRQRSLLDRANDPVRIASRLDYCEKVADALASRMACRDERVPGEVVAGDGARDEHGHLAHATVAAGRGEFSRLRGLPCCSERRTRYVDIRYVMPQHPSARKMVSLHSLLQCIEQRFPLSLIIVAAKRPVLVSATLPARADLAQPPRTSH